MRFMPLKVLDNWDEKKLKLFISEYLEINSMASYSQGLITNSATFFARVLAHTDKRAPQMRWSEAISSPDDCMDFYEELFDHPYAFRRPYGKIIVLTAPYMNGDEAIELFDYVTARHKPLKYVKMTIVPSEYKFIKNGYTMLMFEDCRLAHAAGDDHYTLLEDHK